MEETKELQVKLSKEFNLELDDIFQYGVDTFGIDQAEKYENEIWRSIPELFTQAQQGSLLPHR